MKPDPRWTAGFRFGEQGTANVAHVTERFFVMLLRTKWFLRHRADWLADIVATERQPEILRKRSTLHQQRNLPDPRVARPVRIAERNAKVREQRPLPPEFASPRRRSRLELRSPKERFQVRGSPLDSLR